MKYFKIIFISILFLLLIPSLKGFASEHHNVLLLNPENSHMFLDTILDSLNLSLSENNVSLSYYYVNNSNDENEIKNIENLLKKNRSIAVVSFSKISNDLLDNFSQNYLKDIPVHLITSSVHRFKTENFRENFNIKRIKLDFYKKFDIVIEKHKPKTVNFLINTELKKSSIFPYLIKYITNHPEINFNLVLSDVYEKVTPKLSEPDSLNIVFCNLLKYSNDGAFKIELSPFGTMSKIAIATSNPSYGAFKEFGSRFNIGAFNYSGSYVGHKLAYEILHCAGIAENKFATPTKIPPYDFFINSSFNHSNFFNDNDRYTIKTYNFDNDAPIIYEEKNKFLFTLNGLISLVLLFVILRYFILKRIYKNNLELDKIKSNFIANVSHELRTPLNIIISTISLFELYTKNGEVIFKTDNSKKKFTYLKKNSFRLLKLINNIIDSSKIESGFFTLESNCYNIVEVVEDITLSSIAYAEKKDIFLIFDTVEEEIYTIFDRDKIERVILNLLSNALKFTPPKGSITVEIGNVSNNFLTISISDTGIGIPKEEQNKIFDRFIQSNKSTLNKAEGSGIGLSLCKSIIEAHNGTIFVKSTLGQGSTFFIKLPIVSSFEKINFPSNSRLSELTEIEFSDQ